MTANDLLTGLRIGGIVLFVWLAWRVLFESWEITSRTPQVRVRAWLFFRASILCMCFIMIFLASPENILRANGYISRQTGFWMMCGVTIGAIGYATLVHHALDIANERPRASWLSCILISLVSAGYGAGKILL